MANIPSTTYSNIPAYPKSWYQASSNWSAKTVSVAADRYKLTSPTAMQIDVNNLSLTSTVATEPDLSLDATWDFGQSAVGTWTAGHTYSVGDWVRPATAGGDGANNVFTNYATAQMWANSSAGQVASASTAYPDLTYGPAYLAFNQLLTDAYTLGWMSTAVASWLKIDLGSAKIINKYRMNKGAAARSPNTWTIHGSDDGTNWSDALDTQSGIAGATGWSTYYTFVNNRAYRYYKIDITANNGDATYTAIQELHLVAAPSLVYKCTTLGTALSTEPTWGTTVGGTTAESGGPTWTCYYDDTVASNRAGVDYFIYSCIGTSTVPDIVISRNSTIPEGYTALTSRKIGGFHCLCASAGTLYSTWVTSTAYTLGQTVIPTVPNGYQYRCIANGTSGTQPTWPTTIGTTVGTTPQWICEPLHPLNNYLTGDILPTSVWDLKKRCKNIGYNNNGLAYITELDSWAYIYLPSGSSTAPVSVYGGTILDNVDWNTCVDAGRVVGMKLFRDGEFQVAAGLSNEQTNIYGSADPGTTGGHVDTAGRRCISQYGLEDCCGVQSQWLDEGSYRFGGATAHYHKIVTISGNAETDTSGNAVAVDGSTAQDIAPVWGWKNLPLDKGQLYAQVGSGGDSGDAKMLAGLAWPSGTNSGSRARDLMYGYRWDSAYGSISFRLIAQNVWR